MPALSVQFRATLRQLHAEAEAEAGAGAGLRSVTWVCLTGLSASLSTVAVAAVFVDAGSELRPRWTMHHVHHAQRALHHDVIHASSITLM